MFLVCFRDLFWIMIIAVFAINRLGNASVLIAINVLINTSVHKDLLGLANGLAAMFISFAK